MRTLTILAMLLVGCGGGSSSGFFGPTFPDNRPEHVDQVMTRLSQAPPASEPSVAVGLTGSEVFVWDVGAGSMLWKQPANARTVPHIAGDLVVTQEQSGIVARDLRTGTERFRHEDQAMHLIGAGGEGPLGAIVLSTGGGVGAHSQLIVTRNGDIDWDVEVDHALGAPAVRAGLVFVPWGNQNVSIIDAEAGAEIARVRVADEVVARAFVEQGDVYVGKTGLFRFTSSMASGTREQAAHFTPGVDEAELPGRPEFLVDAYSPPPSPQSAKNRIRLEWHPSGSGEELGLSNDNLYLVFYKLVFALDPSGETVRWVYEHGADIVGAQATDAGLWAADANGSLAMLGASDGLPRPAGDMGVEPQVVRLQPAGASPSGPPQGEAMPVRDQLLAAAQSTDARLVPARVMAISHLAALEEPEVTTNLIALCESERAPAPVQSASCEALAQRSSGGDQIIAALQRHAAYLEGTTSPPVGALARAAVRMEEQRAVPMLIAHLKDPATPAADLAPLLVALKELGDRGAAQPIRDFVRMYHADEPTDELIAALQAGLEALATLQGPVARETLEEIANDPLGIPPVRGRAAQLIQGLDEQQTAAEEQETQRREEAEGPAEDEEEEEAEEEPAEQLPMRINAAVVERVLAPVERQLKQCLLEAEGRPASARLILRLSGDGEIERLSITPEATAGCIEPLVRAQDFPANRRRTSQQVVYTLRR